MRCIIAYREDRYPPLLEFYIHSAPHRRQHLAVLQRYREELVAAAQAAGIKVPITNPVDVSVLFINPNSTDLGNSYLALERAMDAKSLKGPSILKDDALVQKVTMAKFYPE